MCPCRKELVDLTFKNSEPLMLNINSGAKKSGAKKKEPVNSSSEDEGVADPVDEQLIACKSPAIL